MIVFNVAYILIFLPLPLHIIVLLFILLFVFAHDNIFHSVSLIWI